MNLAMALGSRFWGGGLGEFTPAFSTGNPVLTIAQGASGLIDLRVGPQPALRYPLQNDIDRLTNTPNACPNLEEDISYMISTDLFGELTPAFGTKWVSGANPGDVVTWVPSSNIYPGGGNFIDHKLMVEVKIGPSGAQ
jgi:hypothetical protein